MSALKDQDKFFMSITQGEHNPFDYFRALYGKFRDSGLILWCLNKLLAKYLFELTYLNLSTHISTCETI